MNTPHTLSYPADLPPFHRSALLRAEADVRAAEAALWAAREAWALRVQRADEAAAALSRGGPGRAVPQPPRSRHRPAGVQLEHLRPMR